MTESCRLLLSCQDQPGIVAAVTSFLAERAFNITDLDQHSEPFPGKLFMRLSFQAESKAQLNHSAFEAAFQTQVADPFALSWCLRQAAREKKVTILVSQHDHALLELLWQLSSVNDSVKIDQVISNHQSLASMAEHWGVPFTCIPNHKAIKASAEEAMLAQIDPSVDLIVLARYMQVLSADFVQAFQHKIINIHHSFLPAFRGADPYQQAYDLGVKMIGATAHYVTATLDEGPIIAQDVMHMSHRDQVTTLREKGKAIERTVLAKAVRWHLEDRILVEAGKTIVFD